MRVSHLKNKLFFSKFFLLENQLSCRTKRKKKHFTLRSALLWKSKQSIINHGRRRTSQYLELSNLSFSVFCETAWDIKLQNTVMSCTVTHDFLWKRRIKTIISLSLLFLSMLWHWKTLIYLLLLMSSQKNSVAWQLLSCLICFLDMIRLNYI